MKLLKYLLHRPTWQKLPLMPRSFSTDYRPGDVDADTAALMVASHTRCPQGAQLLKRRQGLGTARELIAHLPSRRRRRRRIGAKLMAALRRLAGTTPYDPMRSIVRRHQRMGRR